MHAVRSHDVPEIGSSASSYQILARLARGGMAEIFLARAATGAGVARFVVLKRVLRERARDFEFLRMFLDEARLAAQLQHPNIAQVYDVGKLGDSYFFTMEYVHGVTVRELMIKSSGAPLSVSCALAIAQGTASGLHHAHERIGVDGRPLNIVHRDVSPSNLMVSFEGHVKVVDFGVAKAASREHETKSGTVRGKISYLSPEQASGRDVDRRSDVFSLGVVLWEMLTGQRLYKRASDFASMAAIVGEPTPPPSQLRPDLPSALDALVLRALAKQPDERFQTAQELVDAIDQVGAQIGTAMSPAALSRLVRDVFGSRPEPWIALQAPDDAFTVTAEPVPKELVVSPPANDIDRRLAALTDLSSTLAADDVRPTVPVMIVDRDGTATPPTEPRPFRQPSVTAPVEPRTSRAPLVIGAGAFLLAISLAVGAAIAFSSNKAQPAAPERVPVAAVTPDAASVAGSAIDAPPADASPDAGSAEVEIEIDEPPPPQPSPPSPRELLAACTRGTSATSPTECTLVACRLRQTAKATAWFAKVPASKRTGVVTKCRGFGITLARPKPAGPDCDADPSRCQF
jgi:serine/threonine protein kinase